jgi:hypothetical protein
MCTKNLSLFDVDADVLIPQHEFGKMGTGAVAARYEGCCLVLYGPERPRNVLHVLDAGRVALRPDQHKVIVHHPKSAHAVSFGEESLFRRF